jgi:hypothetical protein
VVDNADNIDRTNQPLPAAGTVVNRWVVWLARLGYTARGSVFIVLGWLALERTFALGGKTTDPVGALREIGQPPFGVLPLSILAIGLVSYALWQLMRAVVDPEGQGSSLKGLSLRTGFLLTGLLHGGLAFSAFRLLLGIHIESSEQQTEAWTAYILVQPFGPWLVGGVGIGVGALGLYQFYKAYRGIFLEELRLEEMGHWAQQWATQSGRLGHGALGSILLLIGIFLLQAAVYFNPEAAGSWRVALQTLAQQGAAPWLLGVVALGLVAYGLFTLLLARYANCLFVSCARLR